jgi:pyruvate-formate lyase-activating enzyme
MNDINSIGFALQPTNVPSFLLDWEITKFCNLNCTYCGTDIHHGGHNNETEHPALAQCLHTIDFMYKYVDLYMNKKKPSQRKVILNIYGGESLLHPDIVQIIQACRDKYQKDYNNKWFLTITCTTNGIIGSNQWAKIASLIDEFTLSYHAETLEKQKQQFFKNALYLSKQNKKFKCVIMMHNNEAMFEECQKAINFCELNNIRYVAKPLDNEEMQWQYSQTQFKTLKTFWINSVSSKQKVEYTKQLDNVANNQGSSINQGRPCCGGRKLSLNGDLKSSVSFVPAQGFRGWYCSVNWFFLFVQQITGLVYTNKDCRTSTSGKVEPLGKLSEYEKILDQLQSQLDSPEPPIIQCVKDICMCGFCAPKAQKSEDYKKLLSRNLSKENYYG